MDYFDILLAKKLSGGGGGNITVEPITITENGTTTAPTGKAFSPIYTDVPLPENAYLLNDIEGLPKDIATFTDGANLPMPKLEVAIEPQQDLHGYDAPWVGGAGKNKFDISKVVSNAEVVNNGTTLSLTTNPQTNNCTAGSPNKLKDYCPTLKEGYTVTFSFKSTGDRKYIYLLGYNDQWDSGTSKTITASMLNSTVLWYTSQGVSTATVSEIQFELGQTATTYAPYSNICPIIGWDEVNVTRCGKNLFDESILLECSGWAVSDGVYSGDSAQVHAKYNNGVPNLAFKPNTQYTFSFTYGQDGSAGIGLAVIIRYTDDTATQKYCALDSVGFVSVNSTAGKSIKKLELSYGANRTIHLSNMQLEEGSTATTYEPYNGQTYTIDLDGTRYGGTLDVVNGVLTVDRIFGEFDGVDEDWGNTGAGNVGNRSNALFNAFPSTDIDTNFVTICNTYEGRSYDNRTFNRINVVWVNPNGSLTVVTDSDIDTAEKFKALLQNTPLQVIAKLATPLTIQLPTTVVKSLRGMNNVYADSGNILDLSYLAKEE